MQKLKRALFLFIAASVVFSLLPVVALAEGEFQVRFDTQDGSEVESITVKEGATVASPEDPARDGYEFTGWFKEGECVNEWHFDTETVASDIVLYAGWKATAVKAVYQVQFDTQGGSAVESITVEEGELAAAPEDPGRDGYEFTGWFKERECANEWRFDTETVASDIVLYAGWKAIPAEVVYLVKYDTRGGNEAESILVKEGALVVPPENPARDGYEFTGWFKEEECTNKWRFDNDTVTSDIVLYAGWKAIPVTATIKAVSRNPDYGSVTGGGKYTVGDAVTLTATPKDGFRFVRWMEPNAGSRQYSFKALKDCTVTAEFAPVGITTITAQSTGFESVRLKWTAVEGASRYEIYSSATKNGTYLKIAAIGATNKREFTHLKLTAGKTYYYRIRVCCVADKVTTYGPYASISAAPVGSTVKSTAVSAGSRSIKVTWSPVSGASGYQIYRSTSKSGTYSKVYTASSTAKSYTNNSLVTGKTYYYKVRGYCVTGDTRIYSGFSETVSAIPAIPAPKLTVVPVSSTKNRLTWSVLTDVSGYQVYRSTAKSGSYSKIFTADDWPTAIYTNTGLKSGKTYYYKIRAFIKSGGTACYGKWSATQSAAPSASAASKYKERSYTIYYQGDPKWGFSSSVSRTACVLTSYAITVKNMDISATPRSVYNSNGKRTPMNMSNLKKNFGVKAVCALSPGSIYLYSFNGHKTYIVKPSANAKAAIKEALNIHPEGVILYFKSGSRAHAIVACKYDGNTIYFSDPGRKKTTLLVFKDTWVSYHHNMTYANLVEMIALDKV